ncbi:MULTISPECIES: three-helix bundle dimerization domain-containing protein [Microbacterium]|uniref:three-helix bundle dimerization domain-containing protein n=1 Tax=Microbacterium TaxID=33882 RepID=UPI002786B4A5|nr:MULTISPECIES: hypothetical protein [Microbacterium]MDQ1082853.1 hypothetical protein [Microbacterium sp. SORGH_AS_0344]MDQ1168378.1 hypothetical protein [Microbacterium proteolyticum]
MDERAVDTSVDAGPREVVAAIDGVPVASFRDVVARLRAEYPREDPAHVEGVVLREWEAFSAGRPLVVPTAVEEGAREILDQLSG